MAEWKAAAARMGRRYEQDAEERKRGPQKRRREPIDDGSLKSVAVFAALVVAWLLSFQIETAVWIAVPVPVVLAIMLWRFRSKRVLYAGSIVVLLLAIVCTFGVVGSSPKTVSSAVLDKWTEQRGPYSPDVSYIPPSTRYMVEVACEDSRTGRLVAILGKPDWDELQVGKQVELSYHEESILGVWQLGLGVDAINSQPMLSGGRSGFRGGGLDIAESVLSLIFGVLPVSILIYKDYEIGAWLKRNF